MLYSSGTTGQPKGVMRCRCPSRRSRRPARSSSGAAAGAVRVHRRRRVPVAGAAVPRRPAAFTIAVHGAGGTAVVMEHFDAEAFLAAVEQHRVTHAQVVPTMFVRLLKLPDDVRARYDVSSLQYVDPRRRAVPGAGQAADDRLVRPGHPRVLRRHRGQRLRLLQQRQLAGPPRHGRRAAQLHRPHRRRRR